MSQTLRPMKNKTACSLLGAFDSVLSEGRKPEKLRTDKGTEFLSESFQQYLKRITFIFIQQTTNQRQV